MIDRHRFSEVIEIVHKKLKVLIHRKLLCDLSSYVAKLVQERTNLRSISLNVEDFSPRMDEFTLLQFVNWVYRNELHDEHNHWSNPLCCDKLIDLYVLADKWEITILKNVVIDLTIDCFDSADCYSNDRFPTRCIGTVYRNTGHGSPLRRLWVDLYLWEMDDAYEEHFESDMFDKAFLKDLSMAQLEFIRNKKRFRSDIPPYRVDSSMYHQSDQKTDVCCCRWEFGETDYDHRSQFFSDEIRDVPTYFQGIQRSSSASELTDGVRKEVPRVRAGNISKCGQGKRNSCS